MKQGVHSTKVYNTCVSAFYQLHYSEIYLSWLTGLRLLIEGNVIDSYIFGDRGFWQVAIICDDHYSSSFRWFSVIIYIIFLFLVAVIMLNLLIAQFSKSYEEVTKSARKSITPDRAKILVDQQLTRWIRLCCVRQYYSHVHTTVQPCIQK